MVYWRNGRLYPVKNLRPAGRGRWQPVLHFVDTELVARIDGDIGTIEITEGPAATPQRVNDALLLARGIAPTSVSPEVWPRLPEAVRSSIEARVREMERKVSSQIGKFSNEEAITGAFFSQLEGSFSQPDGWRASISFVEFSKQVKETMTGTDVAIIVDVLAENGQRSFKTIWLQAKTLSKAPNANTSPPRMRSQLERAEAYCDSSYGLAYSPTGIFVMGALGVDPEPFHRTLDRCMRCEVGDLSIGALKNSLNRKKLLQIILTEGGAPPTRRMRFRQR